MFILKTTEKSGYTARTMYNCKTADFTVAFAFNFGTAGEEMTFKFARPRIYQLPINSFSAFEIDEFCRKYRGYMCDTLHIAGHSSHTLYKYWGRGHQAKADAMVLEFLTEALTQIKVTKIYSGGQTGFDEAGAKAALELGIPLEITMPKGYRIRDVEGRDHYFDRAVDVIHRFI